MTCDCNCNNDKEISNEQLYELVKKMFIHQVQADENTKSLETRIKILEKQYSDFTTDSSSN